MSDIHRAYLFLMVMVSAADGEMSNKELATIGEMVRFLPAFRSFDLDDLPEIAQACSERLTDEAGLDGMLSEIGAVLDGVHRETGYALAVEVAATDGNATQEELRLLEMIRHTLGIERLVAAAIERGARARYTPV